MMPFRRRRPLMRMATGAAVGAVAYNAGKKHVQQAEINDQAQAAYAATQGGQVAPAGDDAMAQLEKLAEMHGSGVLSDDEFRAAKAKLLGL
jgi:hypothetical protein